ncbi:hypothetical protein EUX98_g6573 [Antrodiella citrinella]|uniref:CRAL-TRIO domain-containing protein n=1 Tax=Antrodiella citrinella TaxID=2447956 RepID=A0A4S4MNY8_9APHY|nr:hypothetical protein EUX98_g6573 [Antrodiella citrinella]
MPDHLPLPVPDLADKAKPHGTDLTEEQRELYDAVLKHFDAEDCMLPGVSSDEEGRLTEAEKFWLTYECLLRYLRAVKWHSADAAIKRLEATLKWRREFGWYDKITAEHVEPEGVTGKANVFGFDVDGRPAMYLTPSKQNTEESVRQVEFTFFVVEMAIFLMEPGVETLAIMIDFGDRGKSPSMHQSRTVLDILQSHYPERLGRAIVINVPFIVNIFLKLILPFVDPVTREKVHFNPRVVEDQLFTADQLIQRYGGDREFEYVHEEYWPALLKMAEERKSRWMQRWKEMGGRVGLKEWDYKVGETASRAEKVSAPAEESRISDTATSEKVNTMVEEVPVADLSVQYVAA